MVHNEILDPAGKLCYRQDYVFALIDDDPWDTFRRHLEAPFTVFCTDAVDGVTPTGDVGTVAMWEGERPATFPEVCWNAVGVRLQDGDSYGSAIFSQIILSDGLSAADHGSDLVDFWLLPLPADSEFDLAQLANLRFCGDYTICPILDPGNLEWLQHSPYREFTLELAVKEVTPV